VFSFCRIGSPSTTGNGRLVWSVETKEGTGRRDRDGSSCEENNRNNSNVACDRVYASQTSRRLSNIAVRTFLCSLAPHKFRVCCLHDFSGLIVSLYSTCPKMLSASSHVLMSLEFSSSQTVFYPGYWPRAEVRSAPKPLNWSRWNKEQKRRRTSSARMVNGLSTGDLHHAASYNGCCKPTSNSTT